MLLIFNYAGDAAVVTLLPTQRQKSGQQEKHMSCSEVL